MQTARKSISGEDWSVPTGALNSRLEAARSQIEERFLDGGAVLVTVLETLSKLVELLDSIGNSFKDDEAKAAAERLKMTARLLDAVPAQQTDRKKRLGAIKDFGRSFATHVDAMEEALRYLRTFAMTAKIAGANIPDFSEFAAEIMERILYATQQVKTLGQQVTQLEAQIIRAAGTGASTLDEHMSSLPGIVSRLRKNSDEIDGERKQLSKIAAQVADMARKAQSKVGQTLSAMQIGDITRQRIEHCQSAFEIAETHLADDQSGALSEEQARDVLVVTAQLVHALLSQATGEFDRDSGRVVEIIRSMYGDITSLMRLYDGMMDAGAAKSGGSTLSALHQDLVAVHGIVDEIGSAANEANELGQTTASIVSELTVNVETIQLVRRDIQYMALNTMLRCSRLGDEGRSLNVVSGELRSFSTVLDEHAEQILLNLKKLQGEAQGLRKLSTGQDADATENLADVVDGVIAMLGEAGSALEGNLEALRHSGQDMTTKVMNAVNRLDFKAGIGETLSQCRDEVHGYAAIGVEADAIAQPLSEIGQKIARTYTMIAERTIHAEIFGESEAPAAEAPAPADDDLLEDALF